MLMNLTKDIPSQSRLREMFDYVDGQLIWRERPLSDFKTLNACSVWNSRQIGKVAGSFTKSNRYWQVQIDDRKYRVHRLIFAWHHGTCPAEMQIDHIDGNKENNRVENLRLATAKENKHNVGLTARNTSGFRGVSWDKHRKKFRAEIRIGTKNKHLGSFVAAEDAAAAYAQAAELIYGDFVHPTTLENAT